MKVKTTKKAIMQNSAKVYAIGYCALQRLLNYQVPYAYSAGALGWCCDYYNLGNGRTLSTGYSPAGENLPRELIRKYEDKAEKLTKAEDLKKLFAEFCEEVATIK